MIDTLKKIPPIFYVLPLILVGILLAWNLLPAGEWLKQVQQWVEGLGAWGYLAFLGIYMLATLLMLPGAAFSIAAGLIFQWWGIPLVLVGATAGAAVAFLAGRYIARDRIEKLADGNDKLKAIDTAISEQAWKIVLLVRLSPVVPFNLQNYFFGTTAISFFQHFWATAIGIVPGTVAYVYLGAAGASGSDGGALKWSLLGLGLVATIIVTWYTSKKAKEKLNEQGVAEADSSSNPKATS